jgi:hypothetical protein
VTAAQIFSGGASFGDIFSAVRKSGRVLSDRAFAGPTIDRYHGDLQMHSEWSDGSPTVQEIAEACLERGYQYSAVTDHSYGLQIAGGMSMDEPSNSERPSTL